MIKVHWFRDAPEERNDWLRFGLMELAKKKEIRYSEWDLKQMTAYGFSQEILSKPSHRHLSFLVVDDGNRRVKCIIDNEDSFALFSELIIYADVYFCAGYNSDVFERKSLPKFYNWQTATDVAWYTDLLSKKILRFGDEFYKVKKFIPIGPNLWKDLPIGKRKQLTLNIQHRLRKIFGLSNQYQAVHKVFLSRYDDLMKLRHEKLSFDITLSDTSWGWPTHRIKLHQQLKKLSKEGFNIHSILKLAEPSVCDNSISINLDHKDFPMEIGGILGYEQMLASSKLGVFACGFHWGWRNILTLALFFGIPVVTDRLLTEAYFDIDEFIIHETEDENWLLVKDLLNDLDPFEWEKIKKHNQQVYDKYLHPESVANYFISQINL
ncbi:hypothetical protein [Pedobacter kyonggii]|uniref:Glycosyltransferase family 1 protein n=1 Tax=Pedobacter kyonggii TaxID=1926871 RepID=A0A4V2JGV3_9SPHI|nr:hypothetical protein [Pedobacter kyonggii]TBO42187.1 hypothetical protein EYS08_11715 [Pedobacter kyonggii]